MQVYLYPGYVSLDAAAGGSPTLFDYLKKKGVELEDRNWGGTLESLPKNPSIVRASSMMKCGKKEFARKCAELGHFTFYDDQVVLPDGNYSYEDLIPKLEEFLTKHGEEKMDVALVIPYLRSLPKDTSTLGRGDHARRKAKMVLKLFGEHVINSDVKPSAKFSSMYPVIKLGAVEGSEDMLERMGFDFKTVEGLKGQMTADIEQINGLSTDHSDVQSFYRKLKIGLEQNMSTLEIATNMTNHAYGLGNIPGMMSVELFVGTFQARHNTDSGEFAVNTFLGVMLPILIEKLEALGYPKGSEEEMEWDYDEPPKAHGLQTIAACSPLVGVSISQSIETKRSVKCQQCGHQFEVTIHQELDVDMKTAKGEPEVKGLPDECPECSTSFRKQ